MKFQLKKPTKKDPLRPMFLFFPRQCEDCGKVRWLEFAKPLSEARWWVKCEYGGFMVVPLWGTIIMVLLLAIIYIITILGLTTLISNALPHL